MKSPSHGFVWISFFWPFDGLSLHPFRCRRLWNEVARGLSEEGPSGSAEGAVVEGRADQRVLLLEETPGGAPEKPPGVGVGRAEYDLEFGQGEVRRGIAGAVGGAADWDQGIGVRARRGPPPPGLPPPHPGIRQSNCDDASSPSSPDSSSLLSESDMRIGGLGFRSRSSRRLRCASGRLECRVEVQLPSLEAFSRKSQWPGVWVGLYAASGPARSASRAV